MGVRCGGWSRGRTSCAGDVAGEESAKVQKLKIKNGGRFDLFIPDSDTVEVCHLVPVILKGKVFPVLDDVAGCRDFCLLSDMQVREKR